MSYWSLAATLIFTLQFKDLQLQLILSIIRVNGEGRKEKQYVLT